MNSAGNDETMFAPDQYQLIDFGEGRKLERFGDYVLNRPAPAAAGVARRRPSRWKAADARYRRREGQRGGWSPAGLLPRRWTISSQIGQFELRPTPFGHIGLFVEQAASWQWIAQQVRRAARPLKVLNLFAYTGGSTLAAASAGAEVVHVDAARNVVRWARRNAELSGLSTAPIRWICEDAMRFARRELRRGNRYNAVILDPPTYGHGPRGQTWKLAEHLSGLLQMGAELTNRQRAFLLVTCHTPGFGPAELQASLQAAGFGPRSGTITGSWMTIPTADGRHLRCGAAARWCALS